MVSNEGKAAQRLLKNRKNGNPNIGSIAAAIILSLILIRTFAADAAIVQGRSMLPGMRPGDIVFVFKAAYGLRNPFGGYLLLWSAPKNRDIVAAKRPDNDTVVIKRVRDEGGGDRDSGEVYLLGDNNYESIDSREFGPVPMNNILGRVLRLPRF